VQFSASGQKDRIQAAAVKLSDAPQLLDCLAGGRIKSERSFSVKPTVQIGIITAGQDAGKPPQISPFP
jgi:hypothetical protein